MGWLENFNHDLRGTPNGPKLVFLHGLMGSWTNWRKILPTFEGRYQILSFDQRGHGKSFKPPSGYHPKDFADDLWRILGDLGWSQIDLVGHSMGGRNAVVFASQHPGRVRKLVVEDIGPEGTPENVANIERIFAKVPTPFADKRVAKETILGAFEDQVLANYLYSNITEVEPGVHDWRFSREGILQAVRAGRGEDFWHEWNTLRMPTLLIRGANSDELSHEIYKKMLLQNHLARGVEIPNAGHWVHFDQAQEFARVVEKFLSET